MNSSLVTISYDEESVTFAESGGGELVVREYMGENRSAYQAKIERSGNQLYISEGGRPIFAGSFHRYIEVSLPDGYANSLTVTTSDGDINFPAAGLELPYLRVDSTSGTITLPCAVADSVYLSSARGSMRIGCIAAAQIRLETTAGSAACDRLEGDMAYSTTSGDLEVSGPRQGRGLTGRTTRGLWTWFIMLWTAVCTCSTKTGTLP